MMEERKAERWQKKSVGCRVNKREMGREQKGGISKLNTEGGVTATQRRGVDDDSERAQRRGC